MERPIWDHAATRLCVEGIDNHHCDQCLTTCAPCRLEQITDHAAMVLLDGGRGK